MSVNVTNLDVGLDWLRDQPGDTALMLLREVEALRAEVRPTVVERLKSMGVEWEARIGRHQCFYSFSANLPDGRVLALDRTVNLRNSQNSSAVIEIMLEGVEQHFAQAFKESESEANLRGSRILQTRDFSFRSIGAADVRNIINTDGV